MSVYPYKSSSIQTPEHSLAPNHAACPFHYNIPEIAAILIPTDIGLSAWSVYRASSRTTLATQRNSLSKNKTKAMNKRKMKEGILEGFSVFRG